MKVRVEGKVNQTGKFFIFSCQMSVVSTVFWGHLFFPYSYQLSSVGPVGQSIVSPKKKTSTCGPVVSFPTSGSGFLFHPLGVGEGACVRSDTLFTQKDLILGSTLIHR